jgi:hypothetical protein
MKKVYLQFRTKSDLLSFLEQSNMPLCVVDLVENRILCELPEEALEFALQKLKANLITAENSNRTE